MRCGGHAPYRGVPVVVLGAAGFIGRWVARALCAQEAQVHLAVRNISEAERVFNAYGVHGAVHELDVAVPEALHGLFQRIGPSVTFNLVGYGVDRRERDEEIFFRINADLVSTICDAVFQTADPAWPGQAIVQTGSALEYGSASGNLAENTVSRPTTLYGRSKLAGTKLLERRCRAEGISGVTARLFSVYGPGEHDGRLLPALIETASNGDPLQLTDGSQLRDFTYVEDVAAGLLDLGITERAAHGEVVNLATGKLTSVREFAETAAVQLRLPHDCLMFGSLPLRAEEMRHADVSVDRLRDLIGWVPGTMIQEGIQKTLEFEMS